MCPFINRDDPRCSRHLSLSQLDQAFNVCLNSYRDCPTYARLLLERQQRDRLGLRILLTVEGRSPLPAASQADAVSV